MTIVTALIVGFYKDKERLSEVSSWAIVLNPESNVQGVQTKKLDMLITDPDHPFELNENQSPALLIAYISIGEAESYRGYWDDIKDEPWILEENPNWEENYLVDMRSENWHRVLLERVIPEIVAKGYQGLFLDTIDSASTLNFLNGDEYAGILDAPSEIIRKIRIAFPKLLLIPNNGLDLFDSFAEDVDAIFAEDIHSIPDFKTGEYLKIDIAESESKIKTLKRLGKKYRLPIFVIDYTKESNTQYVEDLISQNKKHRFKPYIAEKELSRVYNPDYV